MHTLTARPSLVKTIFSIGLIATTFFITTNQLKAQESSDTTTASRVSLTAIPPRYGEDGTLKILPGEKTQFQVRIRNTSDQPLTIRSSIKDFILGEDGETPMAVTDTTVSNRWSLAEWTTLVPATQTLQPNQVGAVNVLIEVPADGLPGGHYAMVTHQPDLGAGAGQSTAAITQEVGTLLYTIVDGPINEQAFVRDFKFKEFSEFGPVPFNFTLENASDVHIRPQLTIDIFNVIGQKVATLQPETKNIFPFTSRDFSGKWDQTWGTGYYRAQLTASYGDQGNVIIAKTTFWLLPIKLIVAISIIILTLIAILISVRRHMLHRQDDRNKKIELLEQRLKEVETEKLKKFED